MSEQEERANMLRAMAEKWHDEETLGDETCEHRQLEIHAYIAGYIAASDGKAQLLEALARLLPHVYAPSEWDDHESGDDNSLLRAGIERARAAIRAAEGKD